ncbi:MAG TPA: YigZ family protein [Rhodanobacteraceae bacterium]|nr:YigZ family protein [Rhodanobacteraceae bacterium]
MTATRFTLTAATRHGVEIRKSRFLAVAEPVTDADAAMACVQRLSDPAASHNCWAWRLGQSYRSHDDGEPTGSAGRPILAAIDGQQLDGVAVVVTRWFGGIKLGVGGLIRAYGGTAAECLRQAQRVAVVERCRVTFDCDFALLALLKSRLPAVDAVIDEERYAAEHAGLTLLLPVSQREPLAALLRDLSRGRIQLPPLD